MENQEITDQQDHQDQLDQQAVTDDQAPMELLETKGPKGTRERTERRDHVVRKDEPVTEVHVENPGRSDHRETRGVTENEECREPTERTEKLVLQDNKDHKE